MNWNDLFLYDPAGFLVNKRTGKKAGTIRKDGYTVINVNSKFYLAHRIIWEMHYGAIPDDCQIDHINHIRSDNRIINLRLVNNVLNSRNRRITDKNKSGIVGVNWDTKRNRWRVTIMVNYKSIHVGYFLELSEATKARKDAELLHNFHQNHGK